MFTQLTTVTKLDSRTFDTFLEEQDPFRTAMFDLRKVEMITPGALVNLAAACFALQRSGKDPTVVLDDYSSATSYLMRAGFVGAIDGIANVEPIASTVIVESFEHLHRSNRLLIELTRIQDGSELPALLDQIVDVLRADLEYGKYEAFDVTTGISEVTQNTFEHNTNTSGFIAMQVYTARDGKRFLEIGVADYGHGLRATLERNPKLGPLHSDFDAIRLATQRGVSQYIDPTRGTGLYHLLRITKQLRGSVQVRSGRAKYIYRYDEERSHRFAVPYLPGVQITLQLNQKSDLQKGH